MLTITWIDGRIIVFDKAQQTTYGYLSLYLAGKIRYKDISVEKFDRLNFVDVPEVKLIRILYGI